MEEELIDYCKDSAGQNSFNKTISDRRKAFDKYPPNKIKQYKVLFYLLYSRVTNVKTASTEQLNSKSYIEKVLQPFSKIDFVVDEALLLNLFDYKKRDLATMEDCDVSISNFIFFVYDPILYTKVIKEHKLANYDTERKAHFISCAVENPNYEIAFKKRTQAGLLKMLEGYRQPEILKIAKEIKEADLYKKYD